MRWPGHLPALGPGARVVVCVHLARTSEYDEPPFHVFAIQNGATFSRPDGTTATAQYLLMCPACFEQHGGDPDGCPLGGEGFFYTRDVGQA